MRIAGITIPEGKRLEIGLTAVFGIGRPRALSTLKRLGIDPGARPSALSTKQENELRAALEQYMLEGELRRFVHSNIRRLKDIKSWRGRRHEKHLPVRGQTTKTNSRTVRGNVRKTMTSGRRKLEKT